MFVDASAIVAIFNGEPQADSFTEALEQNAGGLTSAIAVFEATHPARLTMGDCLAYAVARNLKVPLLFRGDGFPKTDIESAV